MSVATVSRVLSNDGEGVRPLTQEAVRAAAAELGYQYHGVAAALRRRRTMQVGVVVPRIANPYFAGLVEALERSLAPLGFDLLLADAQENPATEKARIQSLLNRRADALVIVPTHEQESAPALAPAAGIPVIQLDRRVEDFEADWVGTDNRVGMAALVAHLRARGQVRTISHPVYGDVEMLAPPIHLSDSDVEMVRAPLLGEHTSDVLTAELGLDEPALARLEADGVVARYRG